MWPRFSTEILLGRGGPCARCSRKNSARIIFHRGTAANRPRHENVGALCKFACLITRYHSYHGGTAVGQSLTASLGVHGDAAGALCSPTTTVTAALSVSLIRNAMCSCRYLDYMIKEEGNVAAIIVEPMWGPTAARFRRPNTIRIHTPDLWHASVMKSCQAGFALAKPVIEHWDVLPDTVTTAKGASAAFRK